jgi:hypothetical protein
MSDERFVFTASGHEDVIKAYESISQAASKAGMGAKRSAAGQASEAKRSARAVVNAEERSQAQRIRALDRAEQQRKRRIERGAQSEIRSLERKLEREAALEKRSAEKVQRQKLAIIRSGARAAVRHEQAAAKRLEEARAGRRSAFRSAGGRLIGGVAGALGGLALAGAGTAAYMTGRALSQGSALQEQALRLSIQGGGGAEGATALRKRFQQTAMDVRGVSAEDVAGGVSAFVTKTGRVDVADDMQRVFAEIAMATGATATDIGDAAADLFEKFDVQSMEEMNKALATLAVQGKRGAFELKDAATQLPKLAAAAQRFGIGKGAESVAVLGGLTQIARSATGSPEQAASALEATFRQLSAKAVDLNKFGVKLSGPDGQKRDIRDILAETIANVTDKGALQKGLSGTDAKMVGLQKVFGEEGIRAISPMIARFNEAVANGEDGMKALHDMMNGAIDAGDAESEMRRDLASAQTAASAQLTFAWETFKSTVSDSLLPVVGELAGKFGDWVASADFEGVSEMLRMLGSATRDAVSALESMGILRKKVPTGTESITDANSAREAKLAAETEIAQIQYDATYKRGTRVQDGMRFDPENPTGAMIPNYVMMADEYTPEEQARIDELTGVSSYADSVIEANGRRTALADEIAGATKDEQYSDNVLLNNPIADLIARAAGLENGISTNTGRKIIDQDYAADVHGVDINSKLAELASLDASAKELNADFRSVAAGAKAANDELAKIKAPPGGNSVVQP